jgi:hypothetical protein
MEGSTMLSSYFLLLRKHYQIKQKLKLGSQTQRQNILKQSAINLCKLNDTTGKIRQWGNQVQIVIGLFGSLHPIHSTLLPLVNSSLAVLIEKLTTSWMQLKIKEFKMIASFCVPPSNQIDQAEQGLKIISQLLLALELPPEAKEILADLAFAINIQTEHKFTELYEMVYKHQNQQTLRTIVLAA